MVILWPKSKMAAVRHYENCAVFVFFILYQCVIHVIIQILYVDYVSDICLVHSPLDSANIILQRDCQCEKALQVSIQIMRTILHYLAQKYPTMLHQYCSKMPR
jgi:hypothetical protein